MKTIGIIAEYNPFHNGHKYQIEELKKRTNADYVVIAMSGNFVQRGVPALCDKYSRARMALVCGADLVVELPVLWATASAELFAKGGVSLFSHMGVIDYLGFGAETDNLNLLKQIALVLSEEPTSYKDALSFYLKKGNNFPTARKLALCDLFASDIHLALNIEDNNSHLQNTHLASSFEHNNACLQDVPVSANFKNSNSRLQNTYLASSFEHNNAYLQDVPVSANFKNNNTYLQDTYLSSNFGENNASLQNISAFSNRKNNINISELDELLNSPNNILAIEYLKAIYNQNKRMDIVFSSSNNDNLRSMCGSKQLTPILIQRKGAGYHEKSVNTLHPSATAIRNLLFSSLEKSTYFQNVLSNTNDNFEIKETMPTYNYYTFSEKTTENYNKFSTNELRQLSSAMPQEACSILVNLAKEDALLNERDISAILGYRLLCLKREGYSSFADCSSDFSNKIVKNLSNYTDFSTFCELLKSKELTHTRISRTLLHILLDIKQNDYAFATNLGTIPYLRILGFRKESSKLLSAIKKEATVPLITKVADASSILSPDAYSIFEKDLFASDIYYQLLSQKNGKKPMNEFTHPIVII